MTRNDAMAETIRECLGEGVKRALSVADADALRIKLRKAESALDDLLLCVRERDEAREKLVREQRAADAESEVLTLRYQQAEARVRRLEATLRAGDEFLCAYIDASVSDDEGLLASVDYPELRRLWQRVDDCAQTFGKAVAGAMPELAPYDKEHGR